MITLLRRLFGEAPRRQCSASKPSIKPVLEDLEKREVLNAATVVNAAGAATTFATYGSTLWEKHDYGLWKQIAASGVTGPVSAGTDSYGNAMVVYKQQYGNTFSSFEFSDTTQRSYMLDSQHAWQVSAGRNGYSIDLNNQGSVFLFHDKDFLYSSTGPWWGQWKVVVSSGVTQASIGTDAYNAPMVDVVWSGQGWQWTQTTGWGLLGSGVKKVSAGQWGVSEILYNNGSLYQYSQQSNQQSNMSNNVLDVQAGTDDKGQAAITTLTSDGKEWNYTTTHGWWNFATNGWGDQGGLSNMDHGVMAEFFGSQLSQWNYSTWNWRTL